MHVKALVRSAWLALALALAAFQSLAADFPAPRQGTWVVRDFKFHTGEVLPELKLHYQTVGEPTGEPVLVLHGTGGSAAGFLNAAFAGELFGEGRERDQRQRRHQCDAS